MVINKPNKISRSQLNIKSFNANFKNLMEKLMSLLGDYNYTTDDPSYKYQGTKPGEIDEVQFRVTGSKNVDSYSQFNIIIEVTVQNAKITEEKGKKIVRGTGKIILVSEMVLDYDEKWIKDPILHFLKAIYEKYIYSSTKNNLETKIATEMFNIRDDIKKLLEMK